jgi:hypothetical protein
VVFDSWSIERTVMINFVVLLKCRIVLYCINMKRVWPLLAQLTKPKTSSSQAEFIKPTFLLCRLLIMCF